MKREKKTSIEEKKRKKSEKKKKIEIIKSYKNKKKKGKQGKEKQKKVKNERITKNRRTIKVRRNTYPKKHEAEITKVAKQKTCGGLDPFFSYILIL